MKLAITSQSRPTGVENDNQSVSCTYYLLPSSIDVADVNIISELYTMMMTIGPPRNAGV
jgi:hypothetical protein